jgi:transcriptional regulator with XRE-family HTH domain
MHDQPYRDATLGDMIRERRTTLGMTMREVAGTALSPTAVNNIEKGKINPSIDTLLYLCRVLNLQPEHALIFHPDFSKSAPALLEIVSGKLAKGLVDESITLLYDMYWVAMEQPQLDDLIAQIQFRLAQAFERTGRFDSARNVMNEAYKHYLIQRNVSEQILCLNNLGRYSVGERHINIAISTFRQTVELAHRYGIADLTVGDAQMQLAGALYQHGDLDEALYFSRRAEALFEELPALSEVARSRLQQAIILAALERTDEAHASAMQAYRFFEEQHDRTCLAEAARITGDILCQIGEHAAAKQHYLQALDLYRAHLYEGLPHVEVRLARLELIIGDTEAARNYAKSALSRVNPPREQSKVYTLLAQCDYQSRQIEGYTRYMNLAVRTMEESGDLHAAALIQCELADETHDFNLMSAATRTLRQLYEDRQRSEL